MKFVKALLYIFLIFDFTSALSATMIGKYGFVPNAGQILDQNRKPNQSVLFLFQQNDFQVQLKENGFSYQLSKFIPDPNPAISPSDFRKPGKNIQGSFSLYRVDIELLGMNTQFQTKKENPLEAYFNYYNEHTSGLHTEYLPQYEKVTYLNIYPGIDLEFIANGTFKYNFIVHPGAKLSDIKIRFKGAESEKQNDLSKIKLKTPLGDIIESIPKSYLIENQSVLSEIKVDYVEVSPGVFGLNCNTYQDYLTLIVDPTPWATYFGGTAYENGSSVATDSLGNVFVAGYSYSSIGIATSGAYQSSYGGNNDGFVLKFDDQGTLKWATYYGGNNNDYTYNLSVTQQGNVMVAGLTGSSAGIASSGAWQSSLQGITDAFVVKFSNSGTRIWASYFGGNNLDYGYSVTTDSAENVVLLGYTNSSIGIASSGAYQTALAGSNDAFIAKFNNNGNLIWSTYYGGSNDDYAAGICSDHFGNIYFTGFSASTTGIASSNAYQPYLSGANTNYDAFLVKLNAAGNRIWGTYFGGEEDEDGRSVTVGQSGEIYMVGLTKSSTGIATPNAFQTMYKGEFDAFLARFDSSGQIGWATYFGGDGDDYADGVCVDAFGKIVFTGFTGTKSGLATPNAHQNQLLGDVDAIVVKMDTSGTRIWSTYYGGSLEDYSNGVAIGLSNQVVITGLSNSAALVATANGWQTFLAGTNDAFVVSLSANGNLIPVVNNNLSGSQKICKGTTPALIIGSLPQGGGGTYLFQWLISHTGPNGPYSSAPGTNNGINYSAGAQSSSYWLRRRVVSGGDFDTSNVVSIEIVPLPEPRFQISYTSNCANNNSFTFESLATISDSVSRHCWKLGESESDTSNLAIVNKHYPISGTYLISHWSVNGFGCKDSSTRSVNVLPIPLAIAYTNQINVFCEGDSIMVQSNQLPGIKLNWLKNDFPTGDTNAYVWYNKAGQYSVIQTNTQGCSDTSNAIVVSVNPNPVSKISGESVQNYCFKAGQVLDLIATDTALYYYQWQKGGQNILAANSFKFQVTETGKYRLVVRNQFGCADTSGVHEINLFNFPTSNSIIGPSYIKLPVGIQTYKASRQNSSDFEWILNGNILKQGQDSFVNINFTDAGNYHLQMVENSQNNCVGDTNEIFILVESPEGIGEYNSVAFTVSPNPAKDFLLINFKQHYPDGVSLVNNLGQIVLTFKPDQVQEVLNIADLAPGYYFIEANTENQIFRAKILVSGHD